MKTRSEILWSCVYLCCAMGLNCGDKPESIGHIRAVSLYDSMTVWLKPITDDSLGIAGSQIKVESINQRQLAMEVGIPEAETQFNECQVVRLSRNQGAQRVLDLYLCELNEQTPSEIINSIGISRIGVTGAMVWNQRYIHLIDNTFSILCSYEPFDDSLVRSVNNRLFAIESKSYNLTPTDSLFFVDTVFALGEWINSSDHTIDDLRRIIPVDRVDQDDRDVFSGVAIAHDSLTIRWLLMQEVDCVTLVINSLTMIPIPIAVKSLSIWNPEIANSRAYNDSYTCRNNYHHAKVRLFSNSSAQLESIVLNRKTMNVPLVDE